MKNFRNISNEPKAANVARVSSIYFMKSETKSKSIRIIKKEEEIKKGEPKFSQE